VCRVVGVAAALGDRFLGLACVLLLRHADAAALPPVSPAAGPAPAPRRVLRLRRGRMRRGDRRACVCDPDSCGRTQGEAGWGFEAGAAWLEAALDLDRRHAPLARRLRLLSEPSEHADGATCGP
jgi:hypothetical protein